MILSLTEILPLLNLLLKKSITTTDEPPRDSNPINSINIHNNSNKDSAVTITNDDSDRDVSNNSVTETNRIESNKSESSNNDSNSNKPGRWDGNANK